MAAIRLSNGKYRIVTPEAGARYWQLLNGELEPTDEEAEKISHIERVMLNRNNPLTPLSYYVKNPLPVSNVSTPALNGITEFLNK